MKQAVLSLKRAAWSFRVLPDDAVVSGQHQTINILNSHHAGLGLRPPLLFHPFPIVTELGSVGGVADVDLSFQPAQ